MNVYKINDIISCEFLKIPKSMFANETYRSLSSDAKLTYALLYDRLSLSKLNGWMNEQEEVYLIYTREEIAEDLGITYKKAISAFRELIRERLIAEQRCGQGMPNKIYIVKPELTETQAKEYTKRENLRTAKSAYQEAEPEPGQESEPPKDKAEHTPMGAVPEIPELPNGDIQNHQNGISRPANLAHQELPETQPNQTDISQNNINHTEFSQSVSQGNTFHLYLPDKAEDRQTDGMYKLDEIIENCELEYFDEEERKILYDAIERLFYSRTFRIGNAELPQEKVRSRLYELNAEVLRSALDTLHRNDREIKNITGYLCSTIFNCITEEVSLLHVDPYLNQLRSAEKRRALCI